MASWICVICLILSDVLELCQVVQGPQICSHEQSIEVNRSQLFYCSSASNVSKFIRQSMKVHYVIFQDPQQCH